MQQRQAQRTKCHTRRYRYSVCDQMLRPSKHDKVTVETGRHIAALRIKFKYRWHSLGGALTDRA